MITARIDPDFASWRARAREFLCARTPPEALLWNDGTGSGELFEVIEAGERPAHPSGTSPRIPREFLELARLVACHAEPERWALLYRLAWRLTHGGEGRLLALASDPDLSRATRLSRDVRRDRHKMKAFVRFRKTGENPLNGREQFVAWFEPSHHIVELTAPFFARRFTSLDWSILTPERCAHWDGKRLRFTPGVERSAAPSSDELDDYWRTYYASIFNPARLKLKAMQAEMPRKYWKNLPEAPLIAELAARAATRTTKMIEHGPNLEREHVSSRVPAGVPHFPKLPDRGSPAEVAARADELSWEDLRDSTAACRACPLHERATQAVLGEGPCDAPLMIIGEQPGDREDLVGRPFVGPAGQLLDRALAEAGLDRREAYVTNTVKHFKWTPRGKHRLHAKASASEVTMCKPWVVAEVLKVRPRVVLCLGATAARAFLDPGFSVTRQRGVVEDSPLAARVVATIHPSALLRMRDDGERKEEFERFVADLRTTARLLAGAD